jgi:hypothetical protein
LAVGGTLQKSTSGGLTNLPQRGLISLLCLTKKWLCATCGGFLLGQGLQGLGAWRNIGLAGEKLGLRSGKKELLGAL